MSDPYFLPHGRQGLFAVHSYTYRLAGCPAPEDSPMSAAFHAWMSTRVTDVPETGFAMGAGGDFRSSDL